MKENSVDNKTPQTLTTGFSVGHRGLRCIDPKDLLRRRTPGGVAGGRKPITLISDLSRYLVGLPPINWADRI